VSEKILAAADYKGQQLGVYDGYDSHESYEYILTNGKDYWHVVGCPHRGATQIVPSELTNLVYIQG
jgi:hypothetical protein